MDCRSCGIALIGDERACPSCFAYIERDEPKPKREPAAPSPDLPPTDGPVSSLTNEAVPPLAVQPTPSTSEIAGVESPPAESTAQPTHCAAHPTQPVAGTCSRCGTFMCQECAPRPDRAGALCPACVQRELDAAPEGIGGWLILPAIWCVFSPLVHGATGLYWLFLMSVGVYDEALLVPFLISVGMAAYTLFVAIRFFTRKKNVPALMIAWLVLNVVFSIINAAAADKGAGAVVGSLIVAGLWIPYFVSSRRVMKTFVR